MMLDFLAKSEAVIKILVDGIKGPFYALRSLVKEISGLVERKRSYLLCYGCKYFDSTLRMTEILLQRQ